MVRILFALRAVNYDRHFEGFLRTALDRGHVVHVAFDIEKKRLDGDSRLLVELRRLYPQLTWGPAPAALGEANVGLRADLRYAIDYLRFLDPRFAQARAVRERARQRAPDGLAALAQRGPFGSPRGQRRLDSLLRAAERVAPVPPELLAFLREQAPDVIAVSPLVGLGSPQGEYVRAARALGIPCVVLVASWDNLTNKGLIRDAPDLTIVWNGGQVEEAVELHGLPRDRVRAVGAHTYDHWFGWRPSRDRQLFCAEVGLDAARPILLYTGSSGFVAPNEPQFVRRWADAIRSAEHEELRHAGILVRPHPANHKQWSDVDFDDLPGTVIWPRNGHMPTDERAKRDYYDSIYHCAAVVGINTSALVESAIVGRPVHTVLADDYRDTQGGTLHFDHLVTGGPLKVAADMGEHLRALGAVLDGDGDHIDRNARFLDSFVRPLGLDRPAAPFAVDALEDVATSLGERVSPRASDRLVRRGLYPLLRVAQRGVEIGTAIAPRPIAPARERRPRVRKGTAMRILFCIDHPGILIHFDSTVEELARRGHSIHLVFGRAGKHEEGLRALDMSSGRITVEPVAPRRNDLYTAVASSVRAAADYAHYLDPSLEEATYARKKWRGLAGVPRPLRALDRYDRLPRRVVRALLGACAAIEDAIPTSSTIDTYLDRVDPDVVLVSPLVIQRSYQTDLIKTARAQGRPTALCVASWDNLTSKGLIRVVPDRVIVWNEIQRQEATRYHRVPASRIVVTGAQNFDRWYEREPRRPAEEFRRRMGLPADRPHLLFVGSSRLTLSETDEEQFCRRWLRAVRSCDDPELCDLPVLIRPHPRNVALWEHSDFSDLGDAHVWRRDVSLPVLEDDRADYYDSIYHAAAVVGLNSSALLEAAIIGRPAHTVLVPEFADVQTRLIHYCYTLSRNGGFLREAESLEEHVRLLGEDVRHPERIRPVQRRFVDPFIRPHGAERPAQPFLIAAIERMSDVSVEQEPGPGARSRLLRGVVMITAAVTRAPVLCHNVYMDLGAPVARRVQRTADAVRGGGTGPGHSLRTRLADAMTVTADRLATQASESRAWLKRRGELRGRKALGKLARAAPANSPKSLKARKGPKAQRARSAGGD